MQSILMAEWLVLVTVLLGLATAGLGTFNSLRERRPLWALLPAIAALAFLGIVVAGPDAPVEPIDGGPLPDTREQPFERFYQQFRYELGKRLDSEVQHACKISMLFVYILQSCSFKALKNHLNFD